MKPKPPYGEVLTGEERAALAVAIALLMNSSDDCMKKDMYHAAKDRGEKAEVLRCLVKKFD
jgi:hypothetical protein